MREGEKQWHLIPFIHIKCDDIFFNWFSLSLFSSLRAIFYICLHKNWFIHFVLSFFQMLFILVSSLCYFFMLDIDPKSWVHATNHRRTHHRNSRILDIIHWKTVQSWWTCQFFNELVINRTKKKEEKRREKKTRKVIFGRVFGNFFFSFNFSVKELQIP